jgi:hypothetical protein
MKRKKICETLLGRLPWPAVVWSDGSAKKIHRLQELPERKQLLPEDFRHGRRGAGRCGAVCRLRSRHENTPELREQIKSMLKDEND